MTRHSETPWNPLAALLDASGPTDKRGIPLIERDAPRPPGASRIGMIKMRRTVLTLPVMLAVVLDLSLAAQTASKDAGPPKPTTATMQVQSDLNRLMRGVLYPASNVVFSAQNDNPAEVKPAPGQDPSMAPNPLASTFGGWQAVENAALALSESTNLLLIPGRKCSNGLPIPMNNPDWPKFVQELRDAGMNAYTAAQSKNQDKMVDAADRLSAACARCHQKWRDKPRLADRCK